MGDTIDWLLRESKIAGVDDYGRGSEHGGTISVESLPSREISASSVEIVNSLKSVVRSI